VNVLRQLQSLPPELAGGAVSIGNFDGVHIGHARIVERLKVQAEKLGRPAVVFTFDPHPAMLLRPEEAPPPLTWTERKAELLARLGIDWVIAYPTDELLLSLTPEQFFARIVLQKLSARAMVEGPNFFFGRDRAGDTGLLEKLCQEHEIALEIVESAEQGGQIVSSSRIRRLIGEGEVAEAAQMLTQPYRIRGLVTHGAGRGSKIGFPTANVDAVDTLIPAEGVYAARALIEDEHRAAAVNVGPNPTFGEEARKIEVHVLDFDRPLYGEPLEVEFIDRLRGVRPFGSVDELVAQLGRDIAEVRRLLPGASSGGSD